MTRSDTLHTQTQAPRGAGACSRCLQHPTHTSHERPAFVATDLSSISLVELELCGTVGALMKCTLCGKAVRCVMRNGIKKVHVRLYAEFYTSTIGIKMGSAHPIVPSLCACVRGTV